MGSGYFAVELPQPCSDGTPWCTVATLFPWEGEPTWK